MGHQMRCPFLDEKGLCNIIIKCGEDYLSKTCKTFPRQENSFGKWKEYSLSCSCPAVVDKMNRINGKMKLIYDGEENIWENMSLEHKIRKTMINILQNNRFTFDDRILLIFNMLLFMKKEMVITKEIICKYQNENYLLSLASIWSEIELNNEDSCREMNELFLDIVQNYRKEKNYSFYLKDISYLAEDMEAPISHLELNNFKMAFGRYGQLIENCFVSKIFGNCISDDIDEMILSFQIVITEYVLIKYSAFLRWLINEKKRLSYNDIKDYIVTYSRIIEYNADGMKEFWEDSFDDAIWDFGYMYLLIN